MSKGPLGVPRPFVNRGWPFRQPTQSEINEIIEYHINDLDYDPMTAERHVSEEYLVVLDEFVPDDKGYRGKVAFALADHIDDWAIYWWPDGEVEILEESGSIK